MATILLLAAAGFVLLLTEMFLPGGVLGALGALALLAAVIIGYLQFGAFTGTALLASIAVITLVGFCVWMAIFPRTAVGRRLTLGRTLTSGDTMPGSANLVGMEGLSLTPLHPAGKALLADRRIDVVADADFIETNQPVVVVAGEGSRVVVRKKT